MIHHERKILLRIKAILLLGGSIWALGLHAETLGLGNAADEQYVAGQHYTVLETPVATASAAEAVEVIEVFSYMCIHCYTFDPMLSSWHEAQDDSVDFVRLPAVFDPTWQLLAQAYYTAQSLGVGEEMHEPCSRLCTLTAWMFAMKIQWRNCFSAMQRSIQIRSRKSLVLSQLKVG